jgi:uncharacterized protein
MIAGLLSSSAYPHPADDIRLVETHISWVLLTGNYAYKIKKPVNFGFLDFSTLERRHRFCVEEVRLNRRLAPDLYLDTVAITGTPESPSVGGDGPVLEYAVRMRQFPDGARLDQVAARGELGAGHLDALAQQVAAFHRSLTPAATHMPYGTPDTIAFYARQNFEQIRSRLVERSDLDALAALDTWTEREFARCGPAFEQRRQEGRVRECHGDLHLGNIALLGGEVVVFDCIEFNSELRWIDVASEVAFVAMDLEDRGLGAFGHRFINAWLEATGDYGSLQVLRYYLVYRAMVRAKVAAIRMDQPGVDAAERLADLIGCREYLALALKFTRPRRPALAITHGFSGSGKTTLTQPIVGQFGAVRVRSDVERKRLFGLPADARTGADFGDGIYTREASERTYARLAELAEAIVSAGYTVIVDATFLERKNRLKFREIATRLGVAFLVIDFEASHSMLERWVQERAAAATDASEAGLAVLTRQRATADPLGPDEMDSTVTVESERPESIAAALARLDRLTASS